MLPLTVGTYVSFVDFIGEGYRCPNWPIGFMLTHGCRGEVVKIEAGYSDPVLKKVVPERPLISWEWSWYLRKMASLGYKVPDSAYVNTGPVEWAYKVDMIRQDDMTKEGVRKVEDIRSKVQDILVQWHWKTVLGSLPDCPIRAWLLENYQNPPDEKRLPGDTAILIRHIAAYHFLVLEYENQGKEESAQRYERQRDASLAELDRKLDEHELRPTRTTTAKKSTPQPSKPREEKKMPEKKVTTKKEKVSKATAPPAPAKVGKGGKFTKEMVSSVIRESKPDPGSIARSVLDAFDVKLDKARIADAPNAGVMKMRAGNLVRGELKRQGRLAV
jgi:hypothetical protein